MRVVFTDRQSTLIFPVLKKNLVRLLGLEIYEYHWDTCGTEETFTLSYTLSIMARTIKILNNTPGSSLLSNAPKINLNTWVDCVEEFSSNLNDNNAFSNDDGPHFFIIKQNENDFIKVSPF